ncbi:conjugative transposon protein TraM [Pedobacter jeongneungensis]|uniref:conjugative transposon protein TraM n=1 Tax=Pedobacter jeongneungensis TaxID=947309 RepID=UPI0005644977|nr:conjugative transposon protein TraM [Pedobacter jeongneungensis]
MKNEKIKEKRKILLFLPILILPFLSMAFYAMGGGSGHQYIIAKNHEINSALPEATFGKEKAADKMAIYQQNQKDSIHSADTYLESVAGKLGFSATTDKDPTQDIDLKLQQLNAQINAPIEKSPGTTLKDRNIKVAGMASDVDKLEKLMSTMQGGAGEDQEMKQLSGMLEKVLDIQHPERVRDAYLKQVNNAPDERFAAIPAQVAAKQTLVQGAVIKLVLSDTVTIAGVLVPKGHELFGLCNLTNQRLLVDIKTIRIDKSIIPVDLSIYSLDGIKGIVAPDAIVDNAISGGADDAVRSLQLLTMDQSIGMQAAGAGIDAAKGLFSKKVRRIKIKVKAGFPVLLRDNQIRK